MRLVSANIIARSFSTPRSETGKRHGHGGGAAEGSGCHARFSRLSFQMNAASLPQIKVMRAIDAIGARVLPALRQEVTAWAL